MLIDWYRIRLTMIEFYRLSIWSTCYVLKRATQAAWQPAATVFFLSSSVSNWCQIILTSKTPAFDRLDISSCQCRIGLHPSKIFQEKPARFPHSHINYAYNFLIIFMIICCLYIVIVWNSCIHMYGVGCAEILPKNHPEVTKVIFSIWSMPDLVMFKRNDPLKWTTPKNSYFKWTLLKELLFPYVHCMHTPSLFSS